MKNLDSRVEDALPLINRIMSELELKDLKPQASDVVTVGKGGSLKHIQIEYEILGTLENMLIDNSEQEVLKKIKYQRHSEYILRPDYINSFRMLN